jgi:hypothetical protein
MSSLLVAGPTMRLDTSDGYFIEATLIDSVRLIGFTKNNNNCTGTYLKDMIKKRLTVLFDPGCISENVTVYFTNEAYLSFYQGLSVDVEVEMLALPNQRKSATAKIIKK